MTTIKQIAKTVGITDKAARQRLRRAGMKMPKSGWKFRAVGRITTILMRNEI